MKALLKLVIVVLAALVVAACLRDYFGGWRLRELEADAMASWQPTASFAETRYDRGIPLVPVAAQSEIATIDRFFDFATEEHAVLAQEEANDAARAAGWVPSEPDGWYTKQTNRDVLRTLRIRRDDQRLELTLAG